MSTQKQDTYFFSQDGDGHWYMVPSDKRERFWQLNDGTLAHQDLFIEEFTDYMLGGGIDEIDFIPLVIK